MLFRAVRTELRAAIAELPAADGPSRFAHAALERFGVSYGLPPGDLQRIPATGGAIVVANHPFGGIDGLIAIAVIANLRPDLKVLANGILAQVPALRSVVLPVDPYGGATASRANVPSLRQALRHLERGGILLMFPAGEVSHLSLRRRSVSDPAWSPVAARIVQLSRAPVTPVYFVGRNSMTFQLGGLLHPRLRTLMLMRELLNKTGHCISVRVGRPLPAGRLAAYQQPQELAAHLRATTYLLGGAGQAATEDERPLETLRAPVPVSILEYEIGTLPDTCRLATLGAFTVYVARARDVPHTLQEIGRLREESFRAVGEGTGHTSDIDLYDDYYEHLFVWNAADRRIAGGYRIGRTDDIRRRFGSRGLYLHTLFEFREPFFGLLGPSLELGRSFVSCDYQRSYAPLLLLWRGICEYVARHPRYARLIGPASISNRYDPASRALLVRGLRAHRHEQLLATLVRARQPFAAQLSLGSLFGGSRRLPGIDELDRLVVDREQDGKGLPVLLRHYLKLGARTLAFNVDPQFGHSIDCLITLDLRAVPNSALIKYMSTDSMQRFRQYWNATDATGNAGERGRQGNQAG